MVNLNIFQSTELASHDISCSRGGMQGELLLYFFECSLFWKYSRGAGIFSSIIEVRNLRLTEAIQLVLQ